MGWYMDRSVSGKLFIGFGLIIGLFALVVAMAYSGIAALQHSQARLNTRGLPNLMSLNDLRSDSYRVRGLLIQMLLTTDALKRQELKASIDEQKEQIEQGLQQIERFATNDATYTAWLVEIRSELQDYRATRAQIIGLIEQDRTEEAQQLALGRQDEQYERIRTLITDLVAREREAIKQSVDAANSTAVRLLNLILGAGGVAVVLGGSTLLVMNHTVAKPIGELTRAAERISQGDLRSTLRLVERADDVGVLASAFRRMRDSLREVNGKIRESAAVLASSAAEIVAATAQVASGAAETATAVGETTTTLEEVKQTAHISSQKAKTVSDTAQKSAGIAQSGRSAVEETVHGIGRIREQMESIAQSVVRLSEQGQSIGEIIAAVDDLAEQSNLLAVNAAIEAARAGDYGKGFGVVAQEVRSLAEQSRRATAQVRAILSDIQKATGAAVMATEQGSKAVEAGVHQSSEAGLAICVLADTLAEAAQAALQIAASSQQQLAGMDQVAIAMENIKEATTQNVAGTRQSEEAAQTICRLGQELRLLVDRFKL